MIRVLCILTVGYLTVVHSLVASNASNSAKPIPITVLAGFLGSGKTTLLQSLLQNNEGLRIAVVVNDVASINIDSKLVATKSSAAGMVELQNGCACCSKSEELLASVSELVTMSDLRGDDEGFHHIVVEMSGVADPKSVRSKFQDAVLFDMPLMERVRLDTMVTLVDCSMFLEYLKSSKVARPEDAPELFYREDEDPPDDDNLLTSLPAGLAEVLGTGTVTAADEEDGVAELLVSQSEIADVVVLNKIDLVSDEQVEQVETIVSALNPRATIARTTYGSLPLNSILGVAKGAGVAEAGALDDHRDAVRAVELEPECADPDCTDESHKHSHAHDRACTQPDCTDSTHSHSHSHAVEPSLSSDDSARSDPDSTHSHSHSHAVDSSLSSGDSACSDPDCTDTSHSHSHSHDCSDPDCDDPSHLQDVPSHAGIGTFVYRARRPFHSGRLASFLRHLPLKRGVPPTAEGDPTLSIPESTKNVLRKVIRSKGFAWCADSDLAAMFWSSAGANFELGCIGSWWATLPRTQWPPEAVAAILEDFDDKEHDEASFSQTSVGDRRQEIVFIGPSLDSRSHQTKIASSLDKCLLDDSEWLKYVDKRSDEEALQGLFRSPFTVKVLSY